VLKVSEGVRRIKLRRDSSIGKYSGNRPRRGSNRKSFEAGEIFKEKNQRSGFAGGIREIPLTLVSWRSCARFSP
jgi:hypothetical protein